MKNIIVYALFGAALTATPLVSLTSSTSCTSGTALGSVTITSPTSCRIGLALADVTVPPFFPLRDTGEALVELGLDTFGTTGRFGPSEASASATEVLTAFPRSAGSLSIDLIATASDPADVGKCSITVGASGSNFTQPCDVFGANEFSLTGIPIRFGAPIVITLTGDIISPLGKSGGHSVNMEADIAIFQSNGLAASWAPEPGTLFLAGAGLLIAVGLGRRRR